MQSHYFTKTRKNKEDEDAHGGADASVLATLQSRKRKHRDANTASHGSAGQQLTEMEKQVVALKRLHPDTLLLFECGYRMRFFAQDAENAAAVLGIRAQQHKAFLEASVPVHRTLFHARRLVYAGFKVGVVKQTDSAAMRAATKERSAQRKPLLERCVTDVYTRATIPEMEGSEEDSDEADSCARYIACVVEATVHTKPFFEQSMHVLGEEMKRSQAFSEEVRIGIFMHDVHTGESKFDEFEDDGKRQRLQRALDTLDPVEIVLPAGKLSAYTEQILDNFVTMQSNETMREEDLQSRIRVERVSNEYFDFTESRDIFRRAFLESEDGDFRVVAPPSLPMLCMCSFGGMWQYLSSLGLANTLIAPNYSSIGNSAVVSAAQFYLPVEAHRDLDLFVNATTKHEVGSLFSILNHTKTHAGARRLRDWIRSPLMSMQAIMDRQRTIESLAFPPGSLSPESIPHRIAYEELTTIVLPRCKHLLRFLQQIHLGKALPSQAVGALQILQDLEDQVHSIKTMLDSSNIQDQPTLLERNVSAYPKMNSLLSRLMEYIDVKHAKRNDVEMTIQKRLRMQPSQAREYRELTLALKTLADKYEEILVSCRAILKIQSLEYSTFRGGSMSDIRHLIEVNRADLHDVPPEWLVVNSTKKLVRFHPKEIIQLHVQEEFVKEKKDQLVRSIWRQFVSEVDAQIYVMGMACVDTLANLDALCSLATVAQSYPNYVLPEFVEDSRPMLEIMDGRHPVIETLLEGSSYISNSVLLSSSPTSPGSLMVVSGPNMGGKTSLLRTCALVVILAQIGSFVPASRVRLSVFDGVYTLMHRSTAIGSQQHRNLPACAQELTALGAISRNATNKSLVLIDEIGFGMAARVAEAIGVAQMLYLVNTVGCHVVFATHHTSSIQKLQARLGVKCQTKQLEYYFHDCIDIEAQDMVTFHYNLKDGIASDSFAIETARRAGIASHILERARSLRGYL